MMKSHTSARASAFIVSLQGYSYLCADRDVYHSRRVVLNPAKNRIQWNTTSGLNYGFCEELIEVLDDVGGVCRRSGLFGLIEMFSVSGSFEMAKFVMEITERKTSYYNILVREMCRKCNFKEARDLLDEMRLFGCRPNAKTYNYLLSSLCKNNRDDEACNVLEEMQEAGCPPDALTFEIFIYYTYRLGKLDFAIKFLDQMVSRGLEPRLTTHAALSKAISIPDDMKKHMSREDLAGDLRSRFSSLSFQSSTETG
ncbi:Pentatricopeptide repeat-containing protein [Vitis vinifera]|uniref:Pentatricopeptide repeat-containing protein n=1 Tax=Vitis vinifera TaxID=29760 RepID=A0A438HPD9_VITVI|nr:Pentatricopeptide repeat-containing protein [Vitis vinifera]